MRFLVTGATGFVGSHCVDVLAEAGHEVHALAFRSAARATATVRWHAADLLNDRAAMRAVIAEVRPTHLLHAAWCARPGTYVTDRENYQWLTATVDLAAAFADSGGRRFVGVGTCAEYDLRFGFLREDLTPVAPETPYAIAKDAARRVVESLCASAGVGFAWGRIFTPYGPREHSARLTGFVSRALLTGGTADVSEGSQVRDFLHVRDVASALVAIACSDVSGAVNIASGIPVTVREFLTRLGSALGAVDRIVFGARPLHHWEPRMLVGDNARLRGLGWSPAFDLDSGIADAVRWWRDQP